MLNLGWILPLSLTFFLCLLHCKFSQKAIIKSSNLKNKDFTLKPCSLCYLFIYSSGWVIWHTLSVKKKDLFSEFWLMVFININTNWKGHWLFNLFFHEFHLHIKHFFPSECFKHMHHWCPLKKKTFLILMTYFHAENQPLLSVLLFFCIILMELLIYISYLNVNIKIFIFYIGFLQIFKIFF